MKKEINYTRESKTGYFDYKRMMYEFKPYIMFTNTENYKSRAINTDRLGFRKVVYKKKSIGIDDLKKNFKKSNILIGGSTAFSIGSSSDRDTIHSELTSFGNLCYTLGIRAATSHQEIFSFLKFKNFFPNIRNIIILSGVNDLALACNKESIFYKDFGGIIGDFGHAKNFLYQSGSNLNLNKWIRGFSNLIFYINYIASKSNFIRNLLSFFSYLNKNKLQKKTEEKSSLSTNDRIKNINSMIENDLHTWSLIQKQMNINIIYIFQPNLAWTKKIKTNYEKHIIIYEKKRIKNFYSKDWTNKKMYLKQRNFLSSCCKKYKIKFIDANEMILKSDHKKNFFIDLVHLSNYGNKFMATNINKFLKN